MNMRHLSAISSLALVASLASGCAPQRWSVERADTSAKQGDQETRASNTILLDRQTGDTWMLWPTGDEYHWQKLKR